MKKFFAKLSGRQSQLSKPTLDSISELVYLAAMNRYSEFDPQPNQRHFIQAFAFSLALHTDGIVRSLLLNPQIPDWEPFGKASVPDAIAGLGSFFGLRLAKLVAEEFKEKQEQDETGKRMIADMLFVANKMYGLDSAGVAALAKYEEAEDEEVQGKINSAQSSTRLVLLVDELLGLKTSDAFQNPDAFMVSFSKSSAIAGAIFGARSEFFKTVDAYMAGSSS